MNTIYFSLSQNIDQNKFLNKVKNLLSKHNNSPNKILKIEVVEISSEYNEFIPKLEYIIEKNLENL